MYEIGIGFFLHKHFIHTYISMFIISTFFLWFQRLALITIGCGISQNRKPT